MADPLKILIARKVNGGTSRSLIQLLESKGYVCVHVRESSSVIDEIYRETPDVIVLCVGLRQPSCRQILQKIKSAPSTRDIPVFYLAPRNARSHLRKGFESGMYDYISTPWFREEVTARLQNSRFVYDKVREVERMLDRDYLTGAYNRKFFMERFQEESSWAHRHGEPISIVMIDIDFFKKINDTHGHSTGDLVLQQITKLIESRIRLSDIMARFGGEEFIVLMSNTGAETARAVAESVRQAVAENEFYSENRLRLPVTVSAGVAMFHREPEVTVDNLIGRADAALYRAKETGRNRVICAD
ncbi:MAG TPA: diguanylate cyclase [Dissulfurispiraceae bacterium]|nr:diguanylate cyclase [Dissulfurispiraceae bacterium]